MSNNGKPTEPGKPDEKKKPHTIGEDRGPATWIPETGEGEYNEVTPEPGHLPEGQDSKE